MKRTVHILILSWMVCIGLAIPASSVQAQVPKPTPFQWDPFLDTLQVKTLRFFLETTPVETGLTLDRWPADYSPASIAAIGFGLTCYPIAAERGLCSRSDASRRVLNTLKFLYQLPQGNQAEGVAGFKGFFYHFLDRKTGLRTWNCELSTIDTGLLMAGVLFCQSYFDGKSAVEQEIRALADSLYRRVDWMWFTDGRRGLVTGWYPERGFTEYTWKGYNEAMIMYLLALGSPTHPLPDWYLHEWYSSYKWEAFQGIEYVAFGPLFGHHYSHSWIDFRGIFDRYLWGRGIDYFENARRATYIHRAYAIANPQGYRDYGPDIWGLSACDGPGDTLMIVDGKTRRFWSYRAREVSPSWVDDDGTIAPTAAGGSIAFAPEICVPALKAMKSRYGSLLWGEYGFRDSFNPTFRTAKTGNQTWAAKDYLGIDQGPIAIMIENLRNGMAWEVMKKNPYIIAGLRKAGFSGGWLDTIN